MQRNTGITEPITVEYGFLDNENDAEKLKSNYIDYAEAVVRAVLQYIGYGDYASGTYTVKKGDSLWSIAKKYNITVEELKAANNLTSNLLNVGQTLKIPIIEQVPENYIVYTVSKGDTLYKIANEYGISVDKLIEYNNLTSTNLSVGQRILIPTELDTSLYDTYVVQPGDSLYRIAIKYNTNVENLMSINNLSSNLLNIGQNLLVPKIESIQEAFDYVVKVGDSLYSIANKYNTTVDKIKSINNLTNNVLNVGQTLKIPSKDQITYVVKSGDNLYSIANKYDTTVDNIKKKNNLSSNLLNIGQILII